MSKIETVRLAIIIIVVMAGMTLFAISYFRTSRKLAREPDASRRHPWKAFFLLFFQAIVFFEAMFVVSDLLDGHLQRKLLTQLILVAICMALVVAAGTVWQAAGEQSMRTRFARLVDKAPEELIRRLRPDDRLQQLGLSRSKDPGKKNDERRFFSSDDG